MPKNPNEVKISKAKGRPMLTWVGKRPLERVTAYPAQHIESFSVPGAEDFSSDVDWSDWPDAYPRGGLLFHGDNKDVLAHLLANGFRGKVKLIYIDPPFDSGADYVRKVQLRGVGGTTKIEGEDYTLGEQLQYTDIWANDNYLQFIYERLMLLKELLAADGSIYVHCDVNKSHHLRCLMDEVFGAENLRNEIIWQRVAARSDSKTYNHIHDTIFFYTKTDVFTWNPQFEAHAEEYVEGKYTHVDEDGRHYQLDNITSPNPRPNMTYEWMGHQPPEKGWRYSRETMQKLHDEGRIWYPEDKTKRPRLKRYLDENQGRPLRSIWIDINPVNSQAAERLGYPTQKPEGLLERILSCSSNPGDLVLDSYLGSGTTVLAAQRLGRRWLGCDINKGAIQTTARRLQTIIQNQQDQARAQRQVQFAMDELALQPAQQGFTTWRVNDYDLQIQHNEAVELACEHIGIVRTRSDSYFDGRLGDRLVKIVPFNHPLSPLDLDDVDQELKRRPEEQRDITVVCLGMELAARAWVEQHNANRPINRYHIVELRTDRKYGGFIKHEALSAVIDVKREGDELTVEITDVFSPTIMQRLNMEAGLFRAHIEDWRAVVDCVMLDTQYDGQVFNVVLSDVPVRKQDLVQGRYQLPAPPPGATVAVKVIDMLGEEIVVTQEV